MVKEKRESVPFKRDACMDIVILIVVDTGG